jgi:hypothetical protein
MNFRSLRYSLIALLSVGLLCSDAQAVTAANAYVTVSSSTYGVEDIVPVGADFYVTTRNVGKSSFRADISVKANSPYYLVIPANGRINLGIGESGLYRVKDESGNEDVFSGRVYVLKLDIEPAETNVCWKSTSCTLKLTDDSYPGGTAIWTSSPAGMVGTGKAVTFNPSSLAPGEYVMTAASGIVPAYRDTCVVRIVKVVDLLHQIGASSGWKNFSRPQKILLGKDSKILTNILPDVELCTSLLLWDGSYGVRGSGKIQNHKYIGEPSLTDEDLKTVFTNFGPDPEENFLVCCIVVGIHSNVGPTDSFTSGHAWLTLTDFSEGVPVIVTYGLWGNRPQTTQGSDVHMNYERESGKYNRYFLVKPSQVASFVEFISRKCEWSYFYTCADWAEDGYLIATGETISANDIVGFGTPRAVGRSINSAESRNPTTWDIPFDGGEHASSSSIGDDSSNESSFP